MDYINRLEKLERKLFPNDSLYQRPRRRMAIFFSVLGVVILVYGTAKIMTKLPNRTDGDTAKYQEMLTR
jgi:hypothetical protein